MTDIKRARAEAAPWLPPIVLRVAHYVNAQEDVLAFLHAMPAHARGVALDALVTLLEVSTNLWPVAYGFVLAKMDVATVAKALPALRKISICEGTESTAICERTPLPPTIDVDAHVHAPHQLSVTFGSWVRNISALSISVAGTLDGRALERELGACTKLTSLDVVWSEEKVDQDEFDGLMAAILAACPHLSQLRIASERRSRLRRCNGLVTWLTQPTARELKLINTDFAPRPAKILARTLLSSAMLHTVKLTQVPTTSEAFMDPSSPPLPLQLRNLTIERGGGGANLVSRAFPPYLRKLKLINVSLASFPPLLTLKALQLCSVKLTDDAVADITSLLAISTLLSSLSLADLPDDQLNSILYALPWWLSRQRNDCIVRLCLTKKSAELLVLAMALTHNTHTVNFLVDGDDSLDLSACQRLVTALGATSRMELNFTTHWTKKQTTLLEQHAALRRVKMNGYRFHSPKATPWMAIA
ncbi:hypothetical protein SDRG_08207 [Saprolegnia diclina VS20]|uniref:F-box domain-containing protein n=1 Tax=Saprolegnia diclina (strain VS20) TaxID=1156394 RepID=T0RPK1_SAPDV|nr:hypothetical protein SDRG_08207 [Saprolegnia diclina VS20]EQC34438.1 hypothetical protein SDRG_08207 [Saprolegnia diclina VS20]|eukprot:XP_008612300.1 hypothetical protein SDRG_08207 [Saprolegnia diclina VS20]